MLITLVSLYLKLNIVLLTGFLLWMTVKKIAAFMGGELSFNEELKVARYFFLAVLGFPLVLFVVDNTSGAYEVIPALTIIGQSVSQNIVESLRYEVAATGQSVAAVFLVIALLMTGLILQTFTLIGKFSQLNQVLKNSTLWKHKNSTWIVFSQDVSTPFSTQALGKIQIVLPYQLLESPKNLRLAIKHELQHVRSGDLRWVLFLDVIKPLFFWNPAFYAWHNEFHCLQEYACDEALLNSPGVNAQSYGSCLLEVASHISHKSLIASSNMVPNFSLFKSSKSQLSRRIFMLTTNRNTRFSRAKLIAYSVLLLSSLAACSTAVIPPSGTDPRDRGEFLPLAVQQPKYPQFAITNEVVGWVQVVFDVDAAGQVVNPVVVDGCAVSIDSDSTLELEEYGCLVQSDIFHSVSLNAIESFRFEPQIRAGEAVMTPGVQYVFRFDLSENTQDFSDLLRSAPSRK